MARRVLIIKAPVIEGIPEEELSALVGITVPLVPEGLNYSFSLGGENQESREWKGVLTVDGNVRLQVCYRIDDSDQFARVYLVSCIDLYHYCPAIAPTLRQWFLQRGLENGQLFAFSQDKCSLCNDG